MSKTETQNATPFTPAELAYRDQLVMAAMQGDWASQSSDFGEFTPTILPSEIQNRAKAYFLFAEAVLLERRKHGLPEEQTPKLPTGEPVPITKELGKILTSGSAEETRAALNLPTPHTHTKDDRYGRGGPLGTPRDPRLYSKEELAGMPPEMIAASDATCDRLLKEMGITPKSDTEVNPKDPRLQDGRDLNRNLTIDDFPPGTLVRFPGEDPRSWLAATRVTPHNATLIDGTVLALSSLSSGRVRKRYEVTLSHDGGKTWS